MDCGITYFDTARMYGFGHAEGILGKLMPRYRHRIILTSKAGILPPERSFLRRVASRGVRLLHQAMPKAKDYIPRPEVWEPRFGIFSLPDLRKSIETSLRGLRTDYLDILLLHECTLLDVQDPELLDFLQNLKRQGTIREFGLATGIDETVRIAAAHPVLAPVLQIPNSVWDMNVARLPQRPNGLTIIHSVLTNQMHKFRARLCLDNSLMKEWESATHVDPRDATALGQLFLAHALRVNPGGLVLFYSSKPNNIKANVKLVQQKVIEPAQIEGLTSYLTTNSDRFGISRSSVCYTKLGDSLGIPKSAAT
jgi:aryl-alcohol dehydrogenase-like predicted oxidoreductase